MNYTNLLRGLVFTLISSQAVGMTVTPSELECLAKNVYFEARGESLKGQVAVIQVTLNRVKAKGFPKTICGVVYQSHQFSWTLTKPKIKDWKSYNAILSLTKNVVRGNVKADVTKGSTFYHATYMKPYWSKHFKQVTTIGNHTFYREV